MYVRTSSEPMTGLSDRIINGYSDRGEPERIRTPRDSWRLLGLVAIAALLLAFVSAGCGQTPSVNTAGWQHYESQGGDVQISHPPDWAVVDQSGTTLIHNNRSGVLVWAREAVARDVSAEDLIKEDGRGVAVRTKRRSGEAAYAVVEGGPDDSCGRTYFVYLVVNDGFWYAVCDVSAIRNRIIREDLDVVLTVMGTLQVG